MLGPESLDPRWSIHGGPAAVCIVDASALPALVGDVGTKLVTAPARFLVRCDSRRRNRVARDDPHKIKQSVEMFPMKNPLS